MSQFASTGQVTFDKVEIVSHSGEKYNIAAMLVTLDIFEDVLRQFTHAKLTILDGLNIREQLPITGGETVNISFTCNNEEEERVVEYTFAITSLTDYQPIA